MKGLKKIPTLRQLQNAYQWLQNHRPLNERKIALWSQWTRFDPRLGEQLISHIEKKWKEINPVRLNAELAKQPWPAAMGVLLETVQLFQPRTQKILFENWYGLVMSGIAPENHQQFFIGFHSLAGRQMVLTALKTTDLYAKWGFLGNELMINKAVPLNMTLIPAKRRQAVLQTMIERGQKITVEDYRRQLGYFVSPRQAQRDLQNHPRLKAVGFTKGRFYR